jgi:uncharacterized membrane protein
MHMGRGALPLALLACHSHQEAMARTLTIENMPPLVSGRSVGNARLEPLTAPDDLAFHALLTPNRSLSRDGFKRVLGVVIGVNLVNAVVYLTLGAWPVAFFCGIDILIVWWAFKLSYMQARRHERILLTDDALWVIRVLPSGHETRWKLSPYWVQVRVENEGEHHAQLQLTEKGRTLVLGSFLAPKERGEVGAALRQALRGRGAA